MGKEKINQSEFARRLNYSRPAITKAIKAGQVWRENGKIDPEHPINKAYADRALRNSGNRSEVKAGKAAAALIREIGSVDKVVEILQGAAGNKEDKSADAAPPAKEKQNKQAEPPAPPSAPEPQADLNPEFNKEIASRAIGQQYASDEKRASAAMKNILLAEKMKELIRRRDVEDFWKRVIGAMQNNILTMDERIADEVAAICGVTDPDVVAQVRRRIGDESVSAMTMVKNEADKFPEAVGLT